MSLRLCMYVVTLCYVATMLLCRVVHTGDIKQQYEVFFNLRDLAVMLLCRKCEPGLSAKNIRFFSHQIIARLIECLLIL